MAKKRRNNEFLLLAFVSVVIVVALFIAAPNPTGYEIRSADAVTHDTTGTIWTCIWDTQEGGFRWIHVYEDGTEELIPNLLSADIIRCEKDEFFCENRKCNAQNEGATCECGQMRRIAELGSSS